MSWDSSYNRAVLMGLISSDVRLAMGKDGTPSLDFNLRTHRKFVDRKTGEHRRREENFRVKCFGKVAKQLSAAADKGSRLLVEGRMVSRHLDVKLEGEEKGKVISSFVAADSFSLLSSTKISGADIEF